MEYNKAYFNWLTIEASLSKFEEEIFPLFGRSQNEWIFSKIENSLIENLKVMRELSKEDKSNELLEEINLISDKISLLSRMKTDQYEKEKRDSVLESNPGNVKLLFARNTLGNVIIDGHLADIKKDNDGKYPELIELIKKLESGQTSFNMEKQKMLTNNRNLKGIYELKGFGVRLIYMREKDYTIVIGACVKKTFNDLKYQDTLLNMRNKSEHYRNMVRNGTLDFEKELNYSRKYFDELVGSIERGK